MTAMTSPSATHSHVVGADAVIAVRTTAADIRIRGIAGDNAAVRLVGGDLLEFYTVDATLGRLDVRPITRTPLHLLRDPGPLELEVPVGATLQIESTSGAVHVLDVVGPGTYGTVSAMSSSSASRETSPPRPSRATPRSVPRVRSRSASRPSRATSTSSRRRSTIRDEDDER